MHDPDTIIESQLHQQHAALEANRAADVLTYVGPIDSGIDDEIRDAVEDIKNRKQKLAVILETQGGYIEVVQRIVDTLRHHYGHVEFIVPNFAFSAGTVLVMSGDDIYMDYYAVLGPIDPQIPGPGGGLIPALGYLVQYERLVEKANNGTLNDAELAYLLRRFDPGELYRYEQERELSVSLLTEWLSKYKFKNWTVTDGTKTNVTSQKREERATEIAKKLNDTDRWHSHSRGLSMPVLANDLNLKIIDFGADQTLNPLIRGYYKLLKNCMTVRGRQAVVHTRDRYLPIM